MFKNHRVREGVSISKAKLRLILDYPFFGNLLLGLRIAETRNISTLSTNGDDLKYNPDFFDKHNMKEQVFFILHEIGHIVLMHHEREKGRDHDLFNVACDHAVNLMLSTVNGITLPDNCLCDPKFKGMGAEEIYDKLMEQNKFRLEQEQEELSEMSGEASGQSGPGGQTGEDQNSQDGDDQTEANQDGAGQDEAGQDGDDQKNKYSKEIQDQIEKSKQFGEVEQNNNPDFKEEDVKNQLILSDRISKSSGKEPGGDLTKILADLIDTEVSWEALLAKFLLTKTQSSYNWTKPNPRYSHSDVIMPSLETTDSMTMAVAIDTSGSIDEHLLQRFMSELSSIVETIKYEKIHLLFCNTKVTDHIEFSKYDPFELPKNIYYGGGTSFAPVFRRIEDVGEDIDCLIYFTDLQCSRYGPTPPYPVLWIGPFEKGNIYEEQVPFGETVAIKRQ